MKVGDYVRTNKGNVAKIIKITDLTIICDNIIYPMNNYGFNKQLKKESLKRLGVKSSPNIIDLIEVGDYVNGERVTQVTNGYIEVCYGRDSTDFIKEKNIKSIVAKEQFSQMEYRIGE